MKISTHYNGLCPTVVPDYESGMEIKEGDVIAVSYPDEYVGEIVVNPSEEDMEKLKAETKDMCELFARAAAEDDGESAESWRNYVWVDCPRIELVKAVNLNENVTGADYNCLELIQTIRI